ncbi:MAG TPA: hypothetical protein VN317_00905, partial [Candidatus Methanoperedens sp.]|nr:hypothetical protein [Candidatus Methanoperedens sp.]
SDRQVRGALLRHLLDGGPATPARLASGVAQVAGTDVERLRRLVGALEREGFVRRDGRRLCIAGGGGRSKP